jgi:hypothetical protein
MVNTAKVFVWLESSCTLCFSQQIQRARIYGFGIDNIANTSFGVKKHSNMQRFSLGNNLVFELT